MADAWKVVDLINVTKAFFEKKGINDTARLDAELLLAEVLGCTRIELYVRFDQIVPEPQLGRFRELVRQRGNRKPVKQILGRCEFMSHEFEITPDVLIPRPETEAVVEQALRALDDGQRAVADIGTGSGNIAVSVALARPDVTVYATDRSEAALDVARRNVERHGVADQVELLGGDLFAALANRRLEGRLDCVVSNPPYVAESELTGLMPEVAEYEPRDALISGQNGLEHTLRLLDGAPAFLRPGGSLVLEMGPYTSERTKAAAAAIDAYDQIRIAADLAKAERVLIALKRM